MKPKWVWIATAAAVIGLAVPRTAQAAAIYDVTLDTSPFSGPLYLYFQLTNGEDNDVHNVVTLSEFNFGIGSLEGSPGFEGGASGSFASQVLLTDTEFLNTAIQSFNPGLVLSFRLALTTLFEPGTVPDLVAFSVLDVDGNPLGILDPDAGTFLTLNIDGAAPSISNFGVSLAAVQPVPEPGTLMLMGIGAAGLAGRAWRGRRRATG